MGMKHAPYAPRLLPGSVPILSEYDILVANISAGKDSQTMLRRLVELVDEQGVPRDRIVVVHVDLGRVEWGGTPELARKHAEYYGLRFEIVTRELGDLLDHAMERGLRGKPAFPGYNTRWCTSDHKTSQVYKLMTKLVRELGLRRPAKVLNILGLRAEESAKRAKDLPFSWNRNASYQTKRHVWNWLPIHDMTEAEVWADIHKSGVPYHHAYDLGMPRLSCCFCIYSGEDALILAAQHNPRLAEQYVEVEVATGFRFQDELSMAEVVERAKTTTITSVSNWAA